MLAALEFPSPSPGVSWAAEMAALLLDGGAELTAQDGEGRTLLHIAAAMHDIQLLEMLRTRHLAKGTWGEAVAQQDRYGQTPLHCAAGYCHPEPLDRQPLTQSLTLKPCVL